MSEVWVCNVDELRAGEVRTAHLGIDDGGLPIFALVVRDSNGRLRAYRNLCRHQAIPLDGGSGEFLTRDRRHLVCGTHGALYRLDDGYCVKGPCAGLALDPMRCREKDGGLYVSFPVP